MWHLILVILVLWAFFKLSDQYDEWRERQRQPLRDDDDERFQERIERLSDQAARKYGIKWP